jgi:hypothetical protein
MCRAAVASRSCFDPATRFGDAGPRGSRDDEEDEPDGIFRRRVSFDNESGWIGYVVAHR